DHGRVQEQPPDRGGGPGGRHGVAAARRVSRAVRRGGGDGVRGRGHGRGPPRHRDENRRRACRVVVNNFPTSYATTCPPPPATRRRDRIFEWPRAVEEGMGGPSARAEQAPPEESENGMNQDAGRNRWSF